MRIYKIKYQIYGEEKGRFHRAIIQVGEDERDVFKTLEDRLYEKNKSYIRIHQYQKLERDEKIIEEDYIPSEKKFIENIEAIRKAVIEISGFDPPPKRQREIATRNPNRRIEYLKP
jgi:RNA binding exosome subunit